jgi:hypothetical protein
MVIFHSYVKLPEGTQGFPIVSLGGSRMSAQRYHGIGSVAIGALVRDVVIDHGVMIGPV